MGRHERTTRKPTMIKSVFHASVLGETELLATCAKFWNELANGYYLEHEEVHFDADKDAWVEHESGGGATMMDKDLCESKEIIKKLLALYFSPIVTQDDLKKQDEIIKQAQDFIKE